MNSLPWFTFRVTKGRSDAGEHQSGETPTAYAYGCPALQRNGAAVAARNLAAHRSQETPVQAGTRRARNQGSEPPFQRDSRNCWQPEEKEMSVCTRRPLCPEGKRPRASERQITEQVSVLFLLKLKFRRYQSSEKLSLCRGNTWKLTAAQRAPFETGVQADKRPGAHGYPLL